MGHDHHHSHQPPVWSSVNKAFTIGICLNFLFVIVEAGVGFSIQSMSLLSDAAHNLADAGTLVLSLIAFRLLKVKANDQYTYGYRKTSILVALFNSVILLVSIGAIAFEAIQKSFHPQPLSGSTIAIVAGIGILVNGTTALLFMRNKDKDINIKSAYLHLLSDTLVSAGIVVGGIGIWFTGWYWIDSALSLIVVALILVSTWQLLKESLKLSLDGVPENISIQKIRELAGKIEGVRGLHHIHIWALSSMENAMTAHLVVGAGVGESQVNIIKGNLKHMLQHHHIQHITLETESETESCQSHDCAEEHDEHHAHESTTHG